MLPRFDGSRQVKTMRHAETAVFADQLTIQPYHRFRMGTFQGQHDALATPIFWNDHFTLVPGCTYVMSVGRQEKREFNVPRLPVPGHGRIKVKGTIIQAAGPLGFQTGNITFTLLRHGGGQINDIIKISIVPSFLNANIFSVHLKRPGTSQRLGFGLKGQQWVHG